MTELADQQEPASPQDDFIQLFTRQQRRLYLYILGQIANPSEAEEILQEANVVIWRKCQEFQPGTNFNAWTMQIARFEVLKYHERHRRDKVMFSDAFLELVAMESEQRVDDLERRREALAGCLQKLKPRDRELIQMRYAAGENGRSVAKNLNRPSNSVYQSLGRIRRTLLDCINRRLSIEPA